MDPRLTPEHFRSIQGIKVTHAHKKDVNLIVGINVDPAAGTGFATAFTSRARI
jgi:hypothetical protein